MKLIKSLLTVVLSAVAIGLNAQTTTITGELIDSLTHEGEPYATVRIFKKGNTEKPVVMFVTDDNGKFSQKVKGQGHYLITFNAMGRKELIRRIELGKDGETLHLDSLFIQDDVKQLKGVEVVAQKPLVKMETDKMTYDVQGDVDSKANTVLDMLRKVPMVTVDGQDNITVNGQGSFKVYVDGKPNVMFSANPSQIFKAMPASSVKSIEVVTNPGAKYDAEGVGGVLNIVMNREAGQQQKNMNGYNGNISLTGTNYGWRGSTFLSGQQGKLTYSANLMYDRKQTKDIETTIERTSADGSKMTNSTKGKTAIPFMMGNISLGYELDSMSNIGASLGMTGFSMDNSGHTTNTFSGGLYGSGFSYGNDMVMNNGNKSFNGSVDYQRFLNKARTSNVTLSYLFNTSPETNENRRVYDALPSGIPFPLKNLYSEANTRGTEHTLQADYTTPVAKDQTLNAGMKYINRRNTSDSKFYDLVGDEQIYNKKNSVDYKNTQSILAAYIEYSLKYGKFGAKMGARYEYTWEKVNFIVGPGSDFKKQYGNLVPSASFTYNITPTINIGINYAMRISRPGITYLNPYIDRSNATMLTYGNPDLSVETSHNVSLVFNAFTPKFMVNLTIGENFADNQIEQFSFMDNGILNTTYGNIVRNRWTNVSSFMNYAVTPKTRLIFNGGFDYGDMRASMLGEKHYGWQAMGFLGLQQTLPLDIKWSVFTGGMTKRLNLQGYGNSFSMFTTTVSKSFLKDKLDVSVMFFTPLRDKMRFHHYSHSKDFEQFTRIAFPLRQVGLTVTWKFGNTKKQFRQHQSNITNDFQEKKDDNQMGGVGVGVGM